MLYLLQNLENVALNTLVSESFRVIDFDGNGVDLSITEGILYVNNVASGKSANVVENDDIRIDLTSSSSNSTTKFSVVRQKGIVQGIFSVTTLPVASSAIDSRYFDLEPYEVLSTDSWTPTGTPEYSKFDANLNRSSSKDITTPSGNRVSVRDIVCDYHRDKVYIINPSNLEHFATLDKYLGPVDSGDLYDSGFRYLTAIAYRKSNKIGLYSGLVEVDSIDVTNPIKLQASNNILYCLEKNSNSIKKFTFDPSDNSYVEATVSYSEPILDFILTDQGLSVLHLNKIVDFDSSEITITSAYKFGYNDDQDSYVVSHRDGGKYSHIIGAQGSRTISLKDSGHDYLSYVIPHNNSFYVLGESGSIRVDTSGDSTNLRTSDPFFGLRSDGTNILGSRLYPTIPKRVQNVDTTPDAIDFGEVDTTPVGTIVTSDEMTITGITAPVIVNKPDITGLVVSILKNDIETNTPFQVVDGDKVKIQFTIPFLYRSAFIYPLAISHDVYTFRINSAPGDTLPRITSVPPTPINVNAVDNSISAEWQMPLIEDTIFISTDLGELIKNDTSVGSSDNFTASDSIKLQLNRDVVGVEYATLTYGQNSFKSIIALNEQPWNTDIGETPSITVALVGLGPIGTNYDDRGVDHWKVPIQSTQKTSAARVVLSGAPTVDVEVPNIWNSKIYVNDVDSGRSATVKHGDELKFEITTTAVADIQHLLPIVFPRVAQFYWSMFTEEDAFPDPFDLGITEGHIITDYVVSNEITISGLGSRVNAVVSIPHNTILKKNGVVVGSSDYDVNTGGNNDYRGVTWKDNPNAVTVINGDKLQLEGYPRPPYGITHAFPLTVGRTVGHWRVGTIDVQDEAEPVVKNVVQNDIALMEPELVKTGSQIIANVIEAETFQTKGHVEAGDVPIADRNHNPSVESEQAKSFISHSSDAREVDIAPTSIRYTSLVNSVDTRESISLQFGLVPAQYFTGPVKVAEHTELFDGHSPIKVAEHTEIFGNPEYVKSEASATSLFDVQGYERHTFDLIETESNFDKFNINTVFGRRLTEPAKFDDVTIYFEPLKANHPGFIKYVNHYREVEGGANIQQPTKFISLDRIEFTKDFQIADPDSVSLFDPQYEVVPRGDETQYSPIWIKDENRSPTVYDSMWEKDRIPRETEVTPIFEVISRPIQVEVEAQFITIPRPRTIEIFRETIKGVSGVGREVDESGVFEYDGRPTLISTETPQYEKPECVVNETSSPMYSSFVNSTIEFGSTGEVKLATNSVSDNRQVFASIQEAKDNAEQEYGLTSANYQVIPYESEYIWIRIIPCENMCFACPDAGYIQGG